MAVRSAKQDEGVFSSSSSPSSASSSPSSAQENDSGVVSRTPSPEKSKKKSSEIGVDDEIENGSSETLQTYDAMMNQLNKTAIHQLVNEQDTWDDPSLEGNFLSSNATDVLISSSQNPKKGKPSQKNAPSNREGNNSSSSSVSCAVGGSKSAFHRYSSSQNPKKGCKKTQENDSGVESKTPSPAHACFDFESRFPENLRALENWGRGEVGSWATWAEETLQQNAPQLSMVDNTTDKGEHTTIVVEGPKGISLKGVGPKGPPSTRLSYGHKNKLGEGRRGGCVNLKNFARDLNDFVLAFQSSPYFVLDFQSSQSTPKSAESSKQQDPQKSKKAESSKQQGDKKGNGGSKKKR